MAIPRAPSVSHVPWLEPEESSLVEELCRRGLAIGAALFHIVTPEEMWKARELVFRKWAFDVLFHLSNGPLGFNELTERLGSLRGESLSVRLGQLVNGRVLERTVLSSSPLRVEYRLSSLGEQVAVTAFVLSLSHTEQVRAVTDPDHMRTRFPIGLPDPLDPHSIPQAVHGYVRKARQFAEERKRVSRGYPDAEDSLSTARRFAAMCVRRWEVEILLELLMVPRSFGELRKATGAGDEALSKSLKHLIDLQGAVKTPEIGYSIAPFGLAKIALGAPVVALSYFASHPNPPPPKS